MAQQLKNTLSFANLAPGAQIVLLHKLRSPLDVPLAPDIVFIPSNELSVVTDDISVTLTNNGPEAISGVVLVESWHTVERAFGSVANTDLPTKPFVVVSGEGTGIITPTSPVFVFMPAGIQTGNVYNTFADLIAAKALVQGWKLLQISNDMQFDPGGTLTFAAGTMTYVSPGGPSAIPVAVVGQAVVLTGAANPGNNGQFVIASRPAPDTITFANAAGVTETPYQGAISILGGFIAIIPTAGMPVGGWDMTDTIMMAIDSPANPGGTAPPTVQFGGVQSHGDVQFVNWVKTDGDLKITNANVALPANVIPAVGSIVDFGSGNNGAVNPTLQNNGTAPMWDASNATAFTLRNNGTIGGTSPAITCGAVGPAVMSLVQANSGQVNANMITGTNVAALIGQTIFGDSTQLGRQPNWAGSIGQSRRGWLRTHSQPESLLQVSPVPAAAAVTFANGAAMNATIGFNTTAADIAQTLPIIRAAAPATGAIPFSTAGVLDSTGMFFTVSNVLGTHNVVVSPSAVTPDTFESGELTVVVPPNSSITFLSDGVSKWRVYSTSSRRIPTAPALRVGPGTLDITHESTLFTSNGVGNALVLPNGTYVGQMHNVIHSTVGGAGNTGIITPATPGGNFVTSTLTNHWDFTTFQWDGAHWNVYAAGIGFVGLA